MYKIKTNIFPHLEKAWIFLYRLRSIVSFHCQHEMKYYIYFVDFYIRWLLPYVLYM